MKFFNGLAVAAFVFAIGANTCSACRSTPRAQLIGPDEQIASASRIVIARAESESPIADGNTVYKFVVQRTLLGPVEPVFTIMGAKTPFLDTSYHGHSDPAFWQFRGGRSSANTGCLMSPVFFVGKSYIIFLNSPVTKRSFEQIDTPDGQIDEKDEWLLYITNSLVSRP